MKLKPCKCGSKHFVKSMQVLGRWVSILTVQDDGSIKAEGCGDDVRSTEEPKTVRCDGCGKRHPNPDLSKTKP